MSEKKPCNKHKKFNIYCADCRKASGMPVDTIETIPIDSGGDGDEPPSLSERFKYKPFRKRPKLKKAIPVLIVIAIVAILVIFFWLWPSWISGINLQQQLYLNKADGLSFVKYEFLNFWSTKFFFNKTALTGAIIGCILMSFPPERILLTVIGTRLRFGKPSRLKALIFWWTAGFVIFYFFGMLLDTIGTFSWTIYLIETGELSFSPFTLIFDAFNVIFNQNSTDFITIFVYSNLYLPVILFIFGIIIFRTVLKIVENVYIKRNDYNIAGSVFIIIGLIFGIIYFSLPTMELGGIQIIQIWSIIFSFFGFISIGFLTFIYGKIKLNKDPTNYVMFRPQKIRIAIIAIVIIIIIIIPTIISGFIYINLGNRDIWIEQEWQKKYRREIEWTRATAGLDMFEERPIENFTLSANSSDFEIINNIRQYDQNFSVNYLAAQIGSSFEALADSDIIYFDGVEYWVAPKTIRTTQFSSDPKVINTELYDHIEGFLAMDTFSKNIVNTTDIFNISENYPIFFGESQSSGYSLTQIYGAYDPSILLNTNYSQGIPKNQFVYEGAPDGTLSGLENFWYTFNLGLLGYANRPTNEFLINRNIKTRVASILLPNLQLDYDPYLVFDSARGKMYYAVSIFTSINIGSYAKYPILRFLGICLIDVKTGELNFYRNHMLDTSNDPTYPLWKLYYSQSTYPWQNPPEWLKKQIRYPETLFEIQLQANYRYHVEDSQTWLRQDDFHERPEDGDLFYIETDVGEGIEYAGIDLVEYVGREANLLAGMYVIRHGSHLGEAIFYHTRDSAKNLIGPKTARDTYSSDATYEISLIKGARNGNTLLYPLGNSIYFYVPTYSTTGNLQQLKLAGFVEAFERDVGYGFDVFEAYENLGISPPGEFTLSADTDEPDFDFDGNYTLTWTNSQNAASYSIYYSNESITEINENVTLLASNISTTSYSITSSLNGTIYYIVQAENEYGTKLSNSIQINIEIPPPISYNLNMENTIDLPDDLASFRIQLENTNTNFTAPGYDVKVNLSLYRADVGSYSIIMPPKYYPLGNSTFSEDGLTGITYTVVSEVLNSGEGLIVNGFVNWTAGYGEIFFRYRWELIINGTVYHTEEGLINVFA